MSHSKVEFEHEEIGVNIPEGTLQKRGGCFDQCVWLPQLHYMTITCLGM